MGLSDQVQRLRRRLLGLDAAQERFDLPQQRIDTVGADLGKLAGGMASLRQAVIGEGWVSVHAVPYEQPWGEIDSADDLAVHER